MVTDLVPALHAFAKTAAAVDVAIARGPNAGKKVNGAAIVELLVRILFSQEHAKKLKITTRGGKSGTAWVDGTPQGQVTVFSLFADALRQMDLRFEESSLPDAKERRAKWRRARSELVDRFLTVEGSGTSARFANRAVPVMLQTMLRLVREQTNARCPARETTLACTWAREDLGREVEAMLVAPGFAALADMGDALARSDAPRRELERFLVDRVTGADAPSVRRALLATLADGAGLVAAERAWTPLARAISGAARPRASTRGPGVLDRGLLLLDAATRDTVDPHHALDAVLPLLVLRRDSLRAPLEVFADAIADVNRYDAAAIGPLDAQDHGFLLRTLRELLTSRTRGLAQLYSIVEKRRR